MQSTQAAYPGAFGGQGDAGVQVVVFSCAREKLCRGASHGPHAKPCLHVLALFRVGWRGKSC